MGKDFVSKDSQRKIVKVAWLKVSVPYRSRSQQLQHFLLLAINHAMLTVLLM